MRKKECGFTLIELINVLAIVVVLIMFGLITSANCWYTEGGVLKELQIEYPNAKTIVKTTRNIVADSIIVTSESDAFGRYCLDSNILFNYTFSECK